MDPAPLKTNVVPLIAEGVAGFRPEWLILYTKYLFYVYDLISKWKVE
jgi:hypothetical protein